MYGYSNPPWPAHPALFLDVDGTLLELADHPSRVVPSARLHALLAELPRATGDAVAVVSGRRIEDLDRILAPHSYVAAGVHGLERRDRAGRVFEAKGGRESMPPLRRRVDAFVAAHEGIWVEDKGLAFAVHYRARPELEPDIHRFVGELQSALPPDVEILLGHAVFELKPGVMNKGSAIAAFMEEPPFAGRVPVFVGDDVTDETGFLVVNALGGVSVKVGRGVTAAAWRLEDVSAVLAWLEHVIEVFRAQLTEPGADR